MKYAVLLCVFISTIHNKLNYQVNFTIKFSGKIIENMII